MSAAAVVVRRVTLPDESAQVSVVKTLPTPLSDSAASTPRTSSTLQDHAAGFLAWLTKLRATYGAQFLVLICMVYFVQGFGSFSSLAVSFLMKDTMGLEPARSQAILATAAFPWSIKPLFGILSDSLPLCGFRRKSYLVLINLLGAVATFWLSGVTATTSPSFLTLLLLVTRLATAMSDVIVDALVVERARLDPQNGANDLQSLTWTCMALGGVIGSLLAGPATSHYGPPPVFVISAAAPLVVLALAWHMHEDRAASVPLAACSSLAWHQITLVRATLRVPVIWQSVVFMFAAQACTPVLDQIQFYYSVEVLHFSPEFLGNVAALGFVFLMVGTLVYNAWFKHVPFHAVFRRAQLCLAVVSLAELLLVTRANLKLGISDGWFVLLESMFGEVVARLIGMPLLVLCAKLCPRGIEGTFFALLMANMNLSYAVSSYWGALLADALGIESEKYDLLWLAIVLRSVMMVVPLAFLWMLPNHDPADEVEAATAAAMHTPVTDDEPRDGDEARVHESVQSGILGIKVERSDV
ncbi:Aste57867_2139 [Aphanomyces stellatus]|uniref:Aste57867_2139 protein n=1 Tax=Aphanomyces stellatus TaxID=120398 RepID=A0A485K6Z5_9STRA|nr:hypothetical protein As57867_002134 [Aphanomyces stellatus]VFT79342.1 Aste57867_2139 [Aphanomyces stellatus]